MKYRITTVTKIVVEVEAESSDEARELAVMERAMGRMTLTEDETVKRLKE